MIHLNITFKANLGSSGQKESKTLKYINCKVQATLFQSNWGGFTSWMANAKSTSSHLSFTEILSFAGVQFENRGAKEHKKQASMCFCLFCLLFWHPAPHNPLPKYTSCFVLIPLNFCKGYTCQLLAFWNNPIWETLLVMM